MTLDSRLSDYQTGKVEFVDTHCHIHEAGAKTGGDEFVRDKWATGGFTESQILIDEAADVGVNRLICVGCTLRDSELAVKLAAEQPNCWASVGIHPHEAKDHVRSPEKLQKFTTLLKKPRVVAIGECGLDYYYEHSKKADQKKMLEFQIELAIKHDLPLIFHVREAFDDFWAIFDNYQGIRGVIHSFTDNKLNLEKALKRGLYIGVNGIATFSKTVEKSVTYVTIPSDRLLLETDAPFLTPAPHRGTICQPKHLCVTAEFLAGLREENVADIAKTTTQNACNLFALK